MEISAAGLNLIKRFEGCRLKAYPDPGSRGAPWTIGYGHTGAEVVPGLVITQAQAEAWLRADLAHSQRGTPCQLSPVQPGVAPAQPKCPPTPAAQHSPS